MKQKIQMGETLQSTNPSKTNKQKKQKQEEKEREKQKKNNKQIFNVQTNFWMQYGDAYC